MGRIIRHLSSSFSSVLWASDVFLDGMRPTAVGGPYFRKDLLQLRYTVPALAAGSRDVRVHFNGQRVVMRSSGIGCFTQLTRAECRLTFDAGMDVALASCGL